MDLNIFTQLWGDDFIDLFEKTCFKSLHWPDNLEALRGASWRIFTQEKHFERLGKMFESSPFKPTIIGMDNGVFVPEVGVCPYDKLQGGTILISGLRQEIYTCMHSRQKMFLAPPDTLFGEGSVRAILAAGKQLETTVSVAHARVNKSLINDVTGVTSNAQLVSLAWKHLHPTWVRSELDHPDQSTWLTGVLWEKVNENLYQVQHLLPTAYLVHYNDDDWAFWYGTTSFGSWDHRWPGDNFIRQERQRYITSSDAAFIVEITESDKNIPPVTTEDIKKAHGYNPIAYYNNRHHNSINKMSMVYFRGES